MQHKSVAIIFVYARDTNRHQSQLAAMGGTLGQEMTKLVCFDGDGEICSKGSARACIGIYT